MGFQLSPQQQAVIDWVKNGKGSMNLIARAGCGKTSTLMEIAKVIKGSGFMGAFNKSIAEEFTERLKAQRSFNVQGRTIHSAGMAAWSKVARGVRIDSYKVRGLAKGISSWDRKLQGVICDTVGYAKQACLGVETSFSESCHWQEIIEYYDLADEIPAGIRPERLIEMCIEVYWQSLELCEEVVDFDDMLLAPLYHKAPLQKYDWVLVDEAQDTNLARRLIVFGMLNGSSRMVCVADPAQSIYGFAGASSDSTKLIEEEMKKRGEFTELPLSVTYRCPKAVVALANQWVPDIQAHESAPKGLVTEMSHVDFWGQNFLPNDVILCRNSRPLVGIAQRLRDQGIQCVVEGMSSKGLKALAVKWGEELSIGEFLRELDAYQQREVQKWTEKKNEEKVEAVNNKCGIMIDICERLRESDPVSKIVQRIDFLFGGAGYKVLTLCTIHKSKGREWNRVYLIGRNRYMPSMWAKKDWEIQQEDNLAYVAVTRAKVELVEVEVPFKKKGDDREWWEL